jgi:hypothetical protein
VTIENDEHAMEAKASFQSSQLKLLFVECFLRSSSAINRIKSLVENLSQIGFPQGISLSDCFIFRSACHS